MADEPKADTPETDRPEVDRPKRPRPSRIRSGPTLGSRANVSVPISFGLPMIAVGIALLVAATRTGSVPFWISGAVILAVGFGLFGSGKTL